MCYLPQGWERTPHPAQSWEQKQVDFVTQSAVECLGQSLHIQVC